MRLSSRLAALAVALALAPAARADPPEPPAGPPVDAPATTAPARTTRWTKPRELERNCVGRSVRMPPREVPLGEIVLRFPVGVDGVPGPVEFLTQVNPAMTEAIEEAVRRCRYEAARDGEGRPVQVWIKLPLRFAEDFTDEELRRPNPRLRRHAEVASPTCLREALRRLGHFRGARTVLVRIRVDEAGVPGELAFRPARLDAAERIRIGDAITGCAWVAGVGEDGAPVASFVILPLHLE